MKPNSFAFVKLQQFKLFVGILLGSIFVSGCCGYGDDSGYIHYYKYASVIVLSDKTDSIIALHYDVKTDTLYPNRNYSPLLVSLRMDTWLWVKTLKQEYRLCLSMPNTINYDYDRYCGSDAQLNFESIKVLHSEIGSASVKSYTLSDYSYYTTLYVDSVKLTP